ncbi:helix-turn-helix transcriptional regulator [Anaerolineales bacterium HSG24]|nr:helix-turn-helix transcriptional regulator [Anaerolineales bacterium HSG24]
MEKFGVKLKTLRKQHGMTQRELASTLGIAHGFIGELETGRKMNPSVHLLTKLTRLFDVSFDQLMDDRVELE